MKIITLVGIIGIALFTSCNPKMDVAKEKQTLIEADKAFSGLSEKIGIHNSFTQTIDSSCVLLRRNQKPIVGYNAIISLFKKGDDSQFKMVWKPLSAEVASSGDMGFTYGIYELSSKKDDIPHQKGTYVSIWKRSADGKWKLWLDTGNEGLGE